MKLNLPALGGMKWQVETNDKPPMFPDYVLNQVTNQHGVLTKRPGCAYAYPDRGNHYGFILPAEQRSVTGPFLGGAGANPADGKEGILYNSHKRKTIALGQNGNDRYVFKGVVQASTVTGVHQRLLIFRHKVAADHVTPIYDELPTWNNTFGRLSRNYNDDKIQGEFIEYSMVMSADYSTLYVAILRRWTVSPYDLWIQVVALTVLYENAWDDQGTPAWQQVGNDIENFSGGLEVNSGTHDIDLEIDENGDLHIVYGIRTNGNYVFRYRKYSAGAWSAATTVSDANGNLYGCVVKRDSANNRFYLGYLFVPSAGGANQIQNRYWTNANPALLTGGFRLVQTLVYVQANYEHLYGPVLAIDTNGTQVYAYKLGASTAVSVRIATGTDAAHLQPAQWLATNIWSNFDDRTLLHTNWDVIIKDGIVIGYYGRLISNWRINNPDYRIYRAVMIFDTTDADYTNGYFFGAELVEESDSGFIHRYLTAYNTYESDNPKRLTTIRYGEYPNEAGNPVTESLFNYIRQDRGIFRNVSEIVQKKPHSYKAPIVNGYETLDVLQCETTESGNETDITTGLPSVSYRFYERGTWQWNLMPGQMDEGNNRIVQSTEVVGRANFFDNNGVLRAGCGIESADNVPIWYSLIDRYMYRNEPSALWLLQKRIFRRCLLEPPPIGPNLNSGIAIIETIEVNWGGADVNPIPGVLENFYDDIIVDGESIILLDNAGNGEIRGARVQHPYLKFRDLENAGVVWVDIQNRDELVPPFIEAFVGFALRYDGGQISQITVQHQNAPYRLGMFPAIAVGGFWRLHSMLRVIFRIQRWDSGASDALDPRVTSIIAFVGVRRNAGETKYDVNYRPWQEFYVSKPSDDPFNDEPQNGDSTWQAPDIEGYLRLTGWLDYRAYQMNADTENAIDYIGTGAVIADQDEKSILDGYKHAAIIAERPFYMGVRVNGKKHEDTMMWGVDAINGGERFIVPDLISPAFLKRFSFTIRNGKVHGDDRLIIVGDRDIEWGSLNGDELDWLFGGTKQNLGSLAEYSIIPMFEAAEQGYVAIGVFYLNEHGGGFLFNLTDSIPVTNDILETRILGTNPAGARVETSYSGVKSRAAEDAMAIHIPEHHVFLLHFPTDGVTFVRDFNAENNARSSGFAGGYMWTEWRFGKNPKAWSLSPDGHLLFTDEEFLYRFPPVTDAGTDAGATITFSGRISGIEVGEYAKGFLARIGAMYKMDGTTMNLTLIRDDGKRGDVVVSLATNTIKSKHSRRTGQRKPIEEQFAIAWSPASASAVKSFELHKLFAEVEVYERG